jgi:hypothetical protein
MKGGGEQLLVEGTMRARGEQGYFNYFKHHAARDARAASATLAPDRKKATKK